MNVKRTLLSILAAPILMFGCGTSSDGVTTSVQGSDGTLDGEVVAVALFGGTESEEVSEPAMDAAIAKSLSEKVEGQLNAMLESGELAVEDENGVAKDISAGFNFKRGFFLDIVDERIPFAGGEMILNGGVDLTIRYLGGGKLALVAQGDLAAALEGIEKSGVVRELPYSLELDGSNQMELDGSFAVTIKRWKVSAMSADLISRVVRSDVTATGTIADRSVTAAVDMLDLSLAIANPNVLADPGAFAIVCSGEITFNMSDQTVASCKIAPRCLSCE